MNVKEFLVHLMKRELTTSELEEAIEELQNTVEARENIPF